VRCLLALCLLLISGCAAAPDVPKGPAVYVEHENGRIGGNAAVLDGGRLMLTAHQLPEHREGKLFVLLGDELGYRVEAIASDVAVVRLDGEPRPWPPLSLGRRPRRGEALWIAGWNIGDNGEPRADGIIPIRATRPLGGGFAARRRDGDADLESGISGSPVVRGNGELVGVVRGSAPGGFVLIGLPPEQ